MNEFDHCNFLSLLSSSEKGLKNSGLNGDLNSTLRYWCSAPPVELSGQLRAERYVCRLKACRCGDR